MEFFDCYFHIPLPIVTKHEPSSKIWYKSVHNLFSYRGHRQTHRQTDTQTNAGKKHTPTLSRGEKLLTSVCVSMGTTVVHNTPQNSSNYFPTQLPDNHQSSDAVYWRVAGDCI